MTIKRVLMIVSVMNYGGIESMLMNLFRNIDRDKLQFDFVVHSFQEGDYDKEIEALGGKIYRVFPKNSNLKLNVRQMEEILLKNKYDIVHIHITRAYSFLNAWLAKKCGIRNIIVHSHNIKRKMNFKYRIAHYLSIPLLNYLSTHKLACSYKAGEWLFGEKTMKSGQVKIINNAIDSERFKFNPEKREDLLRKLDLNNKFVVGHVGRFNYQKNHLFLIDIFIEIFIKQKNAVLLLVGSGELEKEIKRKVANLGLIDNVIFLGDRPDIADIMQAMDVFLFPSLFEGLGIVLIEAQAAGLKAFTSANVVPEEVKITDLLEFISLQDSHENWAEKILQYKNGYERNDTSDQVINSHYDIKTEAKKLEEFYLSI